MREIKVSGVFEGGPRNGETQYFPDGLAPSDITVPLGGMATERYVQDGTIRHDEQEMIVRYRFCDGPPMDLNEWFRTGSPPATAPTPPAGTAETHE